MAVKPAQAAGLTIQNPVGLDQPNLSGLLPDGRWLKRMDSAQRLRLKSTGQRLLGLLLQYNSRSDGGEPFLVEGCRLAAEYSQVCAQLGLSLPETVQIFLFFRRSILEAIHVTGCADDEGQRLFRRTNDFLDALMLNLINRYIEATATTLDGRNLPTCK